jgi:hypothetical protein
MTTTMVVQLVLPAVAICVVMALVIGWDRWRERRRDPRRPMAVVDMRTYRDACRRVDRLVALEEWWHAYAVATAITVWAKSERHFGSAKRRRRLQAAYEAWDQRRGEYNPDLDEGVRVL